MAYDHVTAREKLSTTWRLLAEQMIALGYDRADVIATLTGVGLSFGLELGAPDEPRWLRKILTRAFLGSSVISAAEPRDHPCRADDRPRV